MQQGRLQIRSSLSAFASLDCRLESATALALQAEAANTSASAFTSVLSLVPRQGSGCARPAAALDPSAASSTQTVRKNIDLEGEVLAEMLGLAPTTKQPPLAGPSGSGAATPRAWLKGGGARAKHSVSRIARCLVPLKRNSVQTRHARHRHPRDPRDSRQRSEAWPLHSILPRSAQGSVRQGLTSKLTGDGPAA